MGNSKVARLRGIEPPTSAFAVKNINMQLIFLIKYDPIKWAYEEGIIHIDYWASNWMCW